MFNEFFKDKQEEINNHISGEKVMAKESVQKYFEDKALQEAVKKAGEKQEFEI